MSGFLRTLIAVLAIAVAAPALFAQQATMTKKVAVPASGDLADEPWIVVSGSPEENGEPNWIVRKDEEGTPILVCRGTPYGFLRSPDEYADFQFGLEWRYPNDENGNSGVLVYTRPEAKIWPTSLQVQLHQPLAGSVFPTGAATSQNELRNVRNLALPPAQWNKCVITSKSGRLTVEINGKQAGEVTGCEPSRGAIALQSEGSEVHFRRIWLKPLNEEGEPHGAVFRASPSERRTGRRFGWRLRQWLSAGTVHFGVRQIDVGDRDSLAADHHSCRIAGDLPAGVDGAATGPVWHCQYRVVAGCDPRLGD